LHAGSKYPCLALARNTRGPAVGDTYRHVSACRSCILLGRPPVYDVNVAAAVERFHFVKNLMNLTAQTAQDQFARGRVAADAKGGAEHRPAASGLPNVNVRRRHQISSPAPA